MFKKKMAVVASAALALTLAACGSSSDTGASTSSEAAPATSEAPAASSDAPESEAPESEAGGSESAAETSSDGGEEVGGELPPVDPAILEGAVIGFAQVGSESGWRSANTDDIKAAAEEYGVELQFTSAEGDQAKQIASIKTFITQGVDLIAFSPVVETGYEAVLQEADAAGIPVILTDRSVQADPSLYKTFIGSDFILEGQKAGEWALEEFKDADTVKYVQLEGTTGAAPANDRAEGWLDVVGGEAKFEQLATQTGNFTRDDGKKVMEGFLSAYPDIDLVYAHNDDMGLGAIEAIKAAGKVPGVDIKIITVDAVKAGMEALVAGEINFIVECSPLLGQQLFAAASAVLSDPPVEIPARIVTEETTFTQEQAKEVLADRKY